MTGSDALAPMSPRPSTAVPSLTTTTSRSAHVYRLALAASSAIARLTFATPGVYAIERSRGLEIGRVAATESLPPSCPVKISSSVTGAGAPVGSVMGIPVVVSVIPPVGMTELADRTWVTGISPGHAGWDHGLQGKP